MKQLEDIAYTLTKSNRKTLSIYVERDKPVSVLAPEHLSQDEIEALLNKKKYWIYTQLAEIELLNLSRKKRELVNGESFLFLGKPYSLKIVNNLAEPLVLDKDAFYLKKDYIFEGIKLFKQFYKREGYQIISDRIFEFSQKLGVNSPSVRIMELKNRWASCSDKNINFNWKMIMAPLKIIDYIVVHELVHLKYKRHSEQFWSEVDKILPDYWERKNWLRDNGASFDL